MFTLIVSQSFPYAVLISDREGLEESLIVHNATRIDFETQDLLCSTSDGAFPRK